MMALLIQADRDHPTAYAFAGMAISLALTQSLAGGHCLPVSIWRRGDRLFVLGLLTWMAYQLVAVGAD